MTKKKIEVVDIGSIKKNPNNPRIIKDEKFKKLVNSIREFPQMLEVRPIVVDEDMVVLGGNMRLKAIEEVGMKQVPIIRFDNLTEEQKKEFVIKDNVGFGEWDWDAIVSDWMDLPVMDWGLEFPPDIMFDSQEGVSEGLTDPDDVPDVQEIPASVLGDVWLLGDHRLMCGDSTSIDAVEKLMNGEKADLVFTDPPYGISYQSNMRVKTKKFDVLANDDVFLDIAPIIDAFSLGWVFVWTSWKVLPKWFEQFKSFGYPSNQIIWFKGGGGIGDLKKTFLSDYETALVWNRGAELKGKRIGSVWKVGKDGATEYLHPTQKPVALAEEAIDKTTVKKDIVLDLFGGSGSTLIACEKNNRKARLMELDPKYCDVIVKRWQDFTGKNAVLEIDGRTFEEVSNARS